MQQPHRDEAERRGLQNATARGGAAAVGQYLLDGGFSAADISSGQAFYARAVLCTSGAVSGGAAWTPEALRATGSGIFAGKQTLFEGDFFCAWICPPEV